MGNNAPPVVRLIGSLGDRTYPGWLVVVTVLLAIGCFAFAGYTGYSERAQDGYRTEHVRLFLVAGAGLFGLALLMASSERRRLDILSESADRERVDRVAESVFSSEKLHLPQLMNFTSEQINQYHDHTKRRAAQSFTHAQLSAAVGLLILVGGAILAISLREDPAASWPTIGMAALGTTLATYISRTHLYTHMLSLKQLNYYFRQPVVTYQILQAERLAAILDKEQADRLRGKMIETLLQIALDINASSLPAEDPSTNVDSRGPHRPSANAGEEG